MKNNRFVAALLSAALLAPSAAWAEPTAADRATARTLAQEGQDALDGKRYSVSVDRFSRAESLVHAPTLLLGLARAQVGLGNLVEAQENYNRIIREGVASNAPKSWSKALADANKEVQTLSSRIPWVTINVNGPAVPEVVLDTITVPSASLGVRRAVNPGEHTVKASGEGYLPATKTITLTEGQTLSVTLDLEKAPAPPPVAPTEVAVAPAAPEAPKPASGGARKTIGFVALGVGGAGLIAGGITGLLAIQKHNTLNKVCPGGQCPSDIYALNKTTIDTYHTMSTLSTVGFIVGGVGVAAGTILLLTLPKSSSTQMGANDREVSAFVGWGSAGVKGTF